MLYANDGLVSSPEKLGFIMRSLNMKPTLNELKSYYESHKKGISLAHLLLVIRVWDNVCYFKDGQIDFAEFLTILHQHLQAESPTKEIIAAFKAYDVHKTGHVTTKELRSILTKSGERLTNKDGIFLIWFSNRF